MEKTALTAVDSWAGPQAAKKPLSRALETDHVAINYYELEPGDSFGFGYHRHPGQEEVFYIMTGTATFETEDGDVTVMAGEAIRFEPGEWQLGRNAGERQLKALAMGAPADERETELRRECSACGDRQPTRIERAEDEDALVTICEECGAETGRYT
ncbi:MAG: cupin domain-containing protein [Halovenus sp.]|uniref:cupin domain-containing protein n=1 Tax=Halovenus amylolytica TaxID=2500550 RepID=UPI000FE39A32